MEPYQKSLAVDNDYYASHSLIELLKKRFDTYGFNQIKTPIFETYDLYSSVQGTIQLDDMIKLISPEGKVLVLRPDVTIPITQLIATQYTKQKMELRYSYVLDVYRSSFQSNDGYVKTQAGVELIGNPNVEADMEVISLAIDCLLDLRFTNFKIEIGHAGVVKEILDILSLPKDEEDQFKQLIISKNVTGLEEFLLKLDIEPAIKQSLLTIPLLYGKPEEILDQAISLSLTKKMTNALIRLKEVYNMLALYGVGDYFVIDLGLISHMGYYSDIIFQGFIENVGKPILFGGRYDNLAKQFARPIPAIGFAYDVEALLSVKQYPPKLLEQIYIQYEQDYLAEALKLTRKLRNLNYRTILSSSSEIDSNSFLVSITASDNTVFYQGMNYPFIDQDELPILLQSLKEGHS